MRPLTFPAYLFAIVQRPTSSTVIAAFDHTIVDGLSLVIALRELRQIYDLITSAPVMDDTQIGRVLGDPGSFISYCETEAVDTAVDDSDPRIRVWSRFYERCGGTAPTFPLDLGVEEEDRRGRRPMSGCSSTVPTPHGWKRTAYEQEAACSLVC